VLSPLPQEVVSKQRKTRTVRTNTIEEKSLENAASKEEKKAKYKTGTVRHLTNKTVSPAPSAMCPV